MVQTLTRILLLVNSGLVMEEPQEAERCSSAALLPCSCYHAVINGRSLPLSSLLLGGSFGAALTQH